MITSFFFYPKKLPLLLLFLVIFVLADVKSGCSAEVGAAAQRQTIRGHVEEAGKTIQTTRQRVVKVVATGYTAGVESTGKRPGHPLYGITYSGVKVRRDQVSTIAADTKLFPIGTLLFIPGYGYGVVADTGSAIKGKKIDLYFETIEQVYEQWGKRTVDVQVLRKGTGKLSQAWLNQINQAVEVGKAIPESYLES